MPVPVLVGDAGRWWVDGSPLGEVGRTEVLVPTDEAVARWVEAIKRNPEAYRRPTACLRTGT
jgi:hypothetical protein